MKGSDSKTSKKLSRRKMQVIAALVTAPTLKIAAQESGVGESTIYKWLSQDSTFREVLEHSQNEVLDLAIARAQSVADSAVLTLQEIHADSSKPSNARVAAARYLDSRRITLAELGSIKKQIAELKRLYAEAQK